MKKKNQKTVLNLSVNNLIGSLTITVSNSEEASELLEKKLSEALLKVINNCAEGI